MKTISARQTSMNADAYAGFLRLLLTPENRDVATTEDVRAYLRHMERVDPLTPTARRALGHQTERAA